MACSFASFVHYLAFGLVSSYGLVIALKTVAANIFDTLINFYQTSLCGAQQTLIFYTGPRKLDFPFRPN